MAGKADRTREQILDKAQSLFAEKGFKQVTMKDVCQITGMSRFIQSFFIYSGDIPGFT